MWHSQSYQHFKLHPCGQDSLDMQDRNSYTESRKKQVLIRSNKTDARDNHDNHNAKKPYGMSKDEVD